MFQSNSSCSTFCQAGLLLLILGFAGCKTEVDLDSSKVNEPSAELFFRSLPDVGVKKSKEDLLVELDLRNCDNAWLENVSRLKELQNLKSLKAKSKLLNDEALSQICKCTALGALTLQECSISDVGCLELANLTNLKELSLFAAPITGKGLRGISTLKALKKLNLHGTLVGDEDLPLALTGFESLQSLELSETSVGDASIPKIMELPKLDDLNLWKTKITNAAIDRLSSKNLVRLNLDNNPAINDEAVDAICKISTLEFLHLGKTSVTDAGLSRLSELPNLTLLLINDTAVTEPALQSLREQKPRLEIRN